MRTTQINRKIMDNIYGNQCGSDNAFTRKARLIQSMYRVNIGEEEGFGPTRASKRKYGDMNSGGEMSGKNFLMKETFEYAKVRVANKRENETIDGFKIAEADMQMRGPGDIEGTQQSGIAFNLKIANLASDGLLISVNREAAKEVIEDDPNFTKPENKIVELQLQERFTKSIDWSRIS